ncbi:transcriptional repressor [Paracoccus yeei]|jgi:Fur family ferric uptake transcriptional regulator|uniref:Ferric uptake regulation protein n=2 Tax=Paracoccus TaxID=265 RepID=A0A1V0GP30_9RHOB|nr:MULTISPECIES: Fur family transcriptional regulator [Paracoccus]ARC35602.1 transcriptional repressor [Paracoccus yeei]ATQ57286.1 transcriptional repressor [Paracoccus yeei]AWX92375.1 transcriptional repressor [Paracoccus mutanolyticus]AYF01427.1 transcriptional repressor [Paracoccus yeei]MBY0135461.1 transcriptional repressor [Paracoccus yeei]
MDHEARARSFEDALRRAGVRITRQRAALLRVLAAAEDHPDATQLFQRATDAGAGVSLATVYRTLSALEAQGVILKLEFEGEPARFEPADGTHHDHMIDLDTGEVTEFVNDRIERLQAEIADELGYEIVRHRLELYVRRKR